MNSDYISPSPTPEPVDNNTTPVQILKEKNDFVFQDKSNDFEVIFPEKISVNERKEKINKKG